MSAQIEPITWDLVLAYTPASTQFAAECSGSLPAALIQTAFSIASVRAARALDETERREALIEADSYLSQMER